MAFISGTTISYCQFSKLEFLYLFQGTPPFEKPAIAKGITNFVLYKFGHLPQKDWQTMYDLAKMFLHCLNHWKLETPTARKQTMSAEDISAYKVGSLIKSICLQVINVRCYRSLLLPLCNLSIRSEYEAFKHHVSVQPKNHRCTVVESPGTGP